MLLLADLDACCVRPNREAIAKTCGGPMGYGATFLMRMASICPQVSKLVNLWPASRLNELMPWAWAAAHSNNKLAA